MFRLVFIQTNAIKQEFYDDGLILFLNLIYLHD